MCLIRPLLVMNWMNCLPGRLSNTTETLWLLIMFFWENVGFN